MLKALRVLARLSLWVAAIGAGFGTLLWLDARRQALSASPRLEFYWSLFVAIALLSWLAGRWLDRRLAERNLAALARVRETAVFESSGSPWLALALSGLCLLSGTAVPLSLSRGEPWMALVAATLLLLFAWLVWGQLRQWWRPGPTLRMDGSGFDHAMYGPIPWDDIVGIALQTVRVRHSTQHTLFLGVRHPHRYLRRAPALMRWLHGRRAHRHAVFGPLPIPLNALDKDPELIHQSALALRARHEAPLLGHWHPQMENSEIATWLEMQALADDAGRITDELGSLGRVPDPGRMAMLDARMRAHVAREEALRPRVTAAIGASARRNRTHARRAWVLLAVIAALLLLRIVAKLA